MADFGKHLKNKQKIILNDDEFEVPSLGYEQIADVFQILAHFGNKQYKSDAEALASLDKNTIEICKKLVYEAFKLGYPEENELKLKQFISDNFLVLFPKVLEHNAPVGNLEELKKRIKKAKIKNESEGQGRKPTEQE